MNVVALGESVALNSAAAQTAVDLDATPLIAGREGVLIASTVWMAGGAVMKVQTSDDGSSWTDVLTINAQGPTVVKKVTLKNKARLNVTSAGTGGTGSAYLVGGA